MLILKNIKKSFGDVEVFHGITIKIESHQIIGLLGPNGAGKTTLMRIISGFHKANSGQVLWNKNEIDTSSIDHKKMIGYLPENNPLYLSMTTEEYLHFIGDMKGEKRDGKNFWDIIKECGLKSVFHQKIDTLSKGYRQRIGIAAALLGDPQIIILDEPTSGLDPNQIIEIRDLIKKLAKKKTVLLSTHILPEAKAISDRIVIINRGNIVLDEDTKKIKNLEKKFVTLTS